MQSRCFLKSFDQKGNRGWETFSMKTKPEVKTFAISSGRISEMNWVYVLVWAGGRGSMGSWVALLGNSSLK
jgi:hypothetical protein